jgi:hypothetical protein
MPSCEKCGKKLEEDARYCSYCGTPTGVAPPAEQAPILEAHTTPTGEAPPPEQVPIVEAPKPSRSRRIALVLIFLIAIAAAAVVVYQMRPRTFTPQPTQTVMGVDWSGYSVASSLKNPQATVTAVSGTWTVPSISVTPGFSYSASWVGIGGQFDQTLIQTGTEHDIANGQANYSAWYELLPAPPVYLTMSVSPGDTITASIKLQDATTNTWSISLRDTTNGQSYQTNVQYDSSMLSAEWIVERPTIGNRIGLLSDFGSVTFTKCNAVIAGKTDSILDFPSSDFIMNNRQNNPLVAVSAPSTDGTSFTVTFVSAR